MTPKESRKIFYQFTTDRRFSLGNFYWLMNLSTGDNVCPALSNYEYVWIFICTQHIEFYEPDKKEILAKIYYE